MEKMCAKRFCRNLVDDDHLYCEPCIARGHDRPKCSRLGCTRLPQRDRSFCSECSSMGLDSPRTTCDNLPAVPATERGAALLIVLLVVLVLLGAGLVGLHLTSQHTMMASNLTLAEQARIAAEAGLERGRFVLLSSHGLRIQDLLSGSQDPDDQVPSEPSHCDGSRRGAVLVDPATHAKLKNVPYPSLDRNVLPQSAGSVSSAMGRYTVYVRQDQGDCRMGNYACDSYHNADADCFPPPGSPPPNGYVVVRSEATGPDGRSWTFAEQTIRLSLPPGGAGGSPGTGGSGTGGSPGTGGAGGFGGVGGSSQGTGGSGTGGSTNCVSVPCLLYAVQAVAPCGGSITGCITINNNTVVDGYDSSLGPAGPGNQSNASVGMRCSAAGASSCPKNCPSGCITGSINYGQNVNLSTTTLPLPTHTTNNDHLVAPPSSTAAVTPPPDATYYEYLDLDSGGTVTLKAGRYVVEHLNSTPNSTLFIDDTDGPVLLWVLRNLAPNCTVTVKSGSPSSFWLIYLDDDDVNNNSNNHFTGVVFAPAAKVNLNYVVNGAVVGGQVTLNSLSKVHFDNNLKCP